MRYVKINYKYVYEQEMRSSLTHQSQRIVARIDKCTQVPDNRKSIRGDLDTGITIAITK